MKKLKNKELVNNIDTIASLTRKAILGDSRDNSILFRAIQEKGIKLFAMRNERFDGACIWNKKNEEPEIYLNIEQSEARRRFTLSHELGHLIINYGWFPLSPKNKIDNSKKLLSISFREKDKKQDTDDLNEQIMNQFAGAFLMPETLVKEVINGIDDDEKMISEVEEHFGVTRKAAENRLIMLEKING